MGELAGIAIYLIGYLIAVRIIASWMQSDARKSSKNKDWCWREDADASDWSFLGLGAIVWPILAILLLPAGIAKLLGSRLQKFLLPKP